MNHQIDGVVLGYPRVGSSFLASSGMISFPLTEHEGFLRFIGVWSLLFPCCEPQSQHLLLPDLVWLFHISFGQKAAEIWEVCGSMC